MEAKTDACENQRLPKGWVSYFGWFIFALFLAELVSLVFVRTYFADSFDWRNVITQCAAISVLGSLAFVALAARYCPPEATDGVVFLRRAWRRLLIIYVGLVILAVLPTVVILGGVSWRPIAWGGGVVAPLCLLLLAAFWLLTFVTSQLYVERRLLAVSAGIGTGYAFLGPFGSIGPLVAMTTITWGTVLWVKRRNPQTTTGYTGWWLTAMLTVFLLYQAIWNGVPFGWIVTVLLILALPCWAIADVLIRNGRATTTAPTESQQAETNVHQAEGGGGRPTVARSLTLGWTVVVFWMLFWTEPRTVDIGPAPSVYSLPEPSAPSRDLAVYGIGVSDILPGYVAEWNRYNRHEFRNALRLAEYREMKEMADSWNAFVGNEETARQAIKGTSWIAMISLTCFSVWRRNRASVAEGARQSVSDIPGRWHSRSGNAATESTGASNKNAMIKPVHPNLADGSAGVYWLVRGNDCTTGQGREVRVKAWTAEEAALKAGQIGVQGQSFVVLHS